LLTADFDFELPADRIAQHPAPRGDSRLLVVDRDGAERHRRVADLPSLLRAGDLLVLNDTRVIPARLFARRRPGGGRVELLLVDKVGQREWDVLAKPGRKARPGTLLDLVDAAGAPVPGLEAEMIDRPAAGDAGGGDDGRKRVRFSQDVEPHLEAIGHVPLPPYVKRPDEAADRSAYQTVYARHPGAVAAPTAGLHFTHDLLQRLRGAGVGSAMVTLHVGIGTFKPVTAPLVHEHVMERERYAVPAATADAIAETRRRGGRVVAVGTTVVRTLEGAAAAAAVEAGEAPAPVPVPEGAGSTSLFIYPGFRFRVVDALLTNFHLPRSTLLMLVCAFAGRERVLAAYAEAVREGYRFYSYGDAMLVERAGSQVRSAGRASRAARRTAG